MVASDALIVGEDWISEHYFTTDAKSESFQAKVAERRKAWDEDAKTVREDGDPESKVDTVRSRFLAARGSLSADLASLLADAPDVADAKLPDLDARLRTVLGYNTGEYTLKQMGPVIRVTTPDLNEAAPLVIVEAWAAAIVEDLIAKDGRTLLTSYEADATTTYTSVARLLSALFVAEDGPEFALVLAGRWLLVTERARWAEGRYLAVDLQLVCDRNDTKTCGEIDRALTCVSAESLAPDAEGGIWWHGVLEDSINHTVGVSQNLREGVRLSIEIIANEVVQRRKAQGLNPLPQEQAQPLARQALRYLYRILFLLYAEASPELEVLPVGAEEYDQGYGLDRLRELTLVELTGPRAMNGTHLYDSLNRLFSLVDNGHEPPASREGEQEGLVFNSLRADLFLPKATELIDETGLGNAALQRVLRHLLLSKEARGKDRGFISYAELGINQLGAVYEGLMSYTGFFAEEDLYEVAKDGDASKGSWVVPVGRAKGIAEKDFVRVEDEVTGEEKAVVHRRGTFVFRLAGRERQQSASYYTPEVLTRFTVSQALEELLDQDGRTTTAEEILGLTVCEPALGSGAFAIEAVRQLAEQYLRRRQAELGKRIDPEKYPTELQRVKASIALHQVYGVDLNATAVELAEISLWLDTMVSGLQAPWFGLRLRRGNSLIGARRAVYTRAQVNDKSWLKATPADVPMTGMVEEMANETTARQTDGRIHHFLLPASGWGSAVEAKEAVSLAPDKAAALNKWRSSITGKPTAKQLNALVELAHRVEAMWQLTLRRLEIAEAEARRDIPLWGREAPGHTQAVTREEIEKTLGKRNGAYQRLRRVVDAWAALWFWPLTDTDGAVPPTLDQWIDACQQLLGREPEARKNSKGMTTLGAATNWEDLNDAEDLNLDFAGAVNIDEVLNNHPWLKICQSVAEQQGFFHWELDFATVFARGGFDLQLGNPPWVRPQTKINQLLAEGDPWWQLTRNSSESEITAKRTQTLRLPGMLDFTVNTATEIASSTEYLGSQQAFPMLSGMQSDLYRCFISQTWRNSSLTGCVTLVHPESHFTDERAGLLREHTYLRLRRHWQFINELKLYEIQDQKRYGVHVYGAPTNNVHFITACSLYHPDTVERSLRHDGTGDEPGFKDPGGKWDLRPHRGRIFTVTDATLRTWSQVMGDNSASACQTRMVYTINASAASVLEILSDRDRIESLDLLYSAGWHERADRAKGYFESRWGSPASWKDVILQGPHLFVSTPIYKIPNPSMKHQQDWSETDFEKLPADAIPVTAYKPTGDRVRYNTDYTHWEDVPARDHYRIAWRRMAANTGERTLISAIIPPGAAHVDGVFSAGLLHRDMENLIAVCGFLSSLIADFSVRSAPKGDIRAGAVSRLPVVVNHPLQTSLIVRTLRLNCVADAYADLWRDVYREAFATDQWTSGRPRANRPGLGAVTKQWTTNTPLRIAEDRRQALVEIDALVALMLGVTADQLCTIYRTQFSVLYGYDHKDYVYDANGRLTPNSVLSVWRKKGDTITGAERTATNQSGHTYIYELPFRLLDREADMRTAYTEFERRVAAL
jgi:Eco57I restriction-modification methylase